MRVVEGGASLLVVGGMDTHLCCRSTVSTRDFNGKIYNRCIYDKETSITEKGANSEMSSVNLHG